MGRSETSQVKIIVTGPESTGKTLLSEKLAVKFGGLFIEEYARSYILNLKQAYTFEDVLHIADKQVSIMRNSLVSENKIIFYDTYLIITKIWFDLVYNKIPEWIDEEIGKTHDAFYLLCKPDIPWKPDPCRENGGEMRNTLFRKYEEELVNAGMNYGYVEGVGEERTENAANLINNFLLKR